MTIIRYECPECGFPYQSPQDHAPMNDEGQYICADCSGDVTRLQLDGVVVGVEFGHEEGKAIVGVDFGEPLSNYDTLREVMLDSEVSWDVIVDES